MAWLMKIETRCINKGCFATATYKLMDRWNCVLSTYCTTHAKEALKRQNAYEAKRG